MDIVKLQKDTLKEKATDLIKSLKEKEALYLIDNRMNFRVLFYYKENTYFLSEPIVLYKMRRNINVSINSNDILDICKKIEYEFEGTDYLANSTLVKNIDDLIDNHMIDKLVIKVNRMKRDIIDVVSLEYYNDLILINEEGTYAIRKHSDGKLHKLDLSELIYYNYNPDSEDPIVSVLYAIYGKTKDYFPHKFIGYTENEVELDDLVYENSSYNPVMVLTNMASNTLISYERININNQYNYSEDEVFEFVSRILTVNKNDNVYDIVMNIVDEMSSIYNNYQPGVIN